MTEGYRTIRLEPDEPRPPFNCGNTDLNDYFAVDSVIACRELVSISYAVFDTNDKVIAYFCVSNDAIRREDASNAVFKEIRSDIPVEKRYRSMPAVKIGRFAVAKDLSRQGIGSVLMDAIKYDFVYGNKTGCRFITVDAYAEATEFYEKNGFKYLTNSDKTDEQRQMYFDLIITLEEST